MNFKTFDFETLCIKKGGEMRPFLLAKVIDLGCL